MKTTGTILILVLLGAIGGGTFVFRNIQETKRQEIQQKTQQAKLKTKAAEAEKAKAEEETAKAAARKKEAEAKKAEAEAAKAKADVEAKKAETEAAKAKAEAAQAETAKAEAQADAAAAEADKLAARKAADEAAAAAAGAKAKLEAETCARIQAEQAKAQAEAARALAEQTVAEAALKKSENERKTAEAKAAEEHDRKLRMYRRAKTSRSEMIELQAAERRLAREEAGLAPEEESAAVTPAAPAEPPPEPVVVPTAEEARLAGVQWTDGKEPPTPAEAKLVQENRKLSEQTDMVHTRRARKYVAAFGKLIAEAQKENRREDVKYYRKTLVTLVPDYRDVYVAQAEELRLHGKVEAELTVLKELLALVEPSARETLFAWLIERDGAHYAGRLARLVTPEEYVSLYKRLVDVVRHENGDREVREQRLDNYWKWMGPYLQDCFAVRIEQTRAAEGVEGTPAELAAQLLDFVPGQDREIVLIRLLNRDAEYYSSLFVARELVAKGEYVAVMLKLAEMAKQGGDAKRETGLRAILDKYAPDWREG